MPTAKEIARYFISLSERSTPLAITNPFTHTKRKISSYTFCIY
ncbi:hypothetical protein [Mesobacillus subterraneus]|nr:hypothetical protein [Mesobacillus subterraneus]